MICHIPGDFLQDGLESELFLTNLNMTGKSNPFFLINVVFVLLPNGGGRGNIFHYVRYGVTISRTFRGDAILWIERL